MSEESDKEKAKTPEELYKFWQEELETSKKWFQKFQKSGDKVIKAYLDERTTQDDEYGEFSTKLNLFYSNIVTLMSMLYGRIPKVEASRRFADADDDVARVAGEILTRILNTDIEAAGEDISSVFRNGLQDRLLVGLGTARLQYQIDEQKRTTPAIMGEDGTEQAPEVTEDYIASEWIDTVYTHWKDILWSPARTHPEICWKAYRSYLTKEKFKARFPDVDADKVTFSSKGPMSKTKSEKEETQPQAELWEIWDKDKKCVYWWTQSYNKILDHQPDPLELEGFFPDPPPLVSNITTNKFLPKPDYAMSQDLYREIDELETRITMLTRACKVVGVYDKTQDGIKRIFTEGVENDLIPVDNWAQFAEKGGIEGSIAWVPIKEIAEVIAVLTEKQANKISQLYQVTGMNDIMRGAAATGTERTSATQRKLEANYGSIRIEALQNEFARWASDLQNIKAEIIARHYQPQSILEQSNIMSTPDAMFAEEAIKLIKDPARAQWKILVRPETLAIADYAQLKQDRTEYIMGLSQFLQSSAPLMETAPQAMPTLMKLLKWGMAGFRGSNEVEGILDAEITKMEKMPPQPKADPSADKAKAEQAKMQMEMQIAQQKSQAEMKMAQDKHQADMALAQQKMGAEQQKAQMEMRQAQMEFQLKMQELQMEFKMEMTKLGAELRAQKQARAVDHAYDVAGREHEASVQVRSGEQELERDRQRAKLKDKSNGDA